MIYEDLPRGRARIASCLPTQLAKAYLNCCTMAGWHSCNDLYCQSYTDGYTDHLLIYTVDGKGRLEIRGKVYQLERDSVVIVPSSTPMKYYTDQSFGHWEFYWLDLTGERTTLLCNNLCRDGCCYSRRMLMHTKYFESLLEASISETERSELIGQILDRIVSEVIFEADRKNSVADKILKYVSENYSEQISLLQMSKTFYLSQNQIIRIIRKRTGYTPHEYLTRFRLTKACELLQYTQMPIEDVGRAVGYDNNSHFSAAFRSLYGISPTEFREHFSNP